MHSILPSIIFFVFFIIVLGLVYGFFRNRYKFMKEVYMETGKYPYGFYKMTGILYSLPVFVILFILYRFLDFNQDRSWLYFPAIVLFPSGIFGLMWEIIHAKKVRNKTKRQKIIDWISIFLIGLMYIFILYMLLTHSYIY